ncbi:uncharacterized protein LOC121905273 isoform X1 [Scomber scombrus]|uniref:Uncharacterized protein LOC121905273 isoform X1 n=1 Tax=Scomber scombrus TaxID=13677 RepID=A0AAV1NN73_SCOSC
MPSNIKGMKGSCLVIPCRYDYYRYPPRRPDRVVWYQYVSRGYPLVYDNWYSYDVIQIFRDKTSRYTSTYSKDCSLQINPLDWSHHRQKIYPWVDPENVGSSTYRFFDTTVTIEVVDRAEKPDIVIFGEMKMGKSVTVQCTVYHTCPSYPPNLSVNIPGHHRLTPSSLSDGTSKITLTATMNIESDQQTVECLVRHTGGLTAKSSKTLNAECTLLRILNITTSEEFLDGYSKTITCTALYTCPQHLPTLTWNYDSMPASTDIKKTGSAQWKAVSTLTFTASANDHGRSLICYSRFTGGQKLEASITLRVKNEFTYNDIQPADLKVIWYLYQSNKYPPVYGQTQDVMNKYRGKTSLTGSVSTGNCSLKIERLEMSHNQERLYPWVDKNPITSYHTQDFTFNDKTTQLIVSGPFEDIRMDEWQGEATEDVAKSVICSVSYKCKKNTPVIVWNYENMQNSPNSKRISSNTFKTVSNLTFIGSLEDDGKSLTCTARFMTGETSASAILHIKMLSNLAATVPSRFKALTRSCVVIPCSFQHHDDLPMTRGIWSKKAGGVVYHNGRSNVLDHFKDRTRILGDLSEGNCTLEIDDIKPFDNGPFCFHAERQNDKYKFSNSCVFIIMKASPEKPVITPVPAEVDAGSTVSVSCSVTHTCPSHPPVFSWSVPHFTSKITHTETTQGIWETTSTITFMAAGGDGVQSLNCTATSWRGKQQASTVKLNVKGSLTYQLKRTLQVVIPVSILVLIIITLAAVFGVVIYRKRRHTNDSLTPPPRPEKRRSLWGRLSRRSIWSRFSRRVDDDHVGWHAERKPRNNITTKNCDTPIAKQRFPSPKNNRRPPRPVKPEDNCAVDYNVYGNI